MKKIKIRVVLFFINYIFRGTRFFRLKRNFLRLCDIEVGENSKIVGPIDLGTQIKVKIGDNCWIGKNISFDGNGYIQIDDNVDIAPHVVINTGSHIIGNSDRRAGDGVVNNIIIKRGTWIGTRTTIINNITIGEGVVVAAGTLVNKDIDENVLVAGVPAKLKRNL